MRAPRIADLRAHHGQDAHFLSAPSGALSSIFGAGAPMELPHSEPPSSAVRLDGSWDLARDQVLARRRAPREDALATALLMDTKARIYQAQALCYAPPLIADVASTFSVLGRTQIGR